MQINLHKNLHSSFVAPHKINVKFSKIQLQLHIWRIYRWFFRIFVNISCILDVCKLLQIIGHFLLLETAWDCKLWNKLKDLQELRTWYITVLACVKSSFWPKKQLFETFFFIKLWNNMQEISLLIILIFLG